MGTLLCGSVLFAALWVGSLAQDVPHGTGTWDAEKLGNHRAVLQVSQPSDAVWAHVTWRRRDGQPEAKNILLLEANSGERINNAFRVNINRSFGDIIFQARRSGTYYAYFMPYVMEGRNYPKVTYQSPEESADPDWLERHGLKPGLTAPKQADYPQATAAAIEAIDDFSSFHPMEVIASREETAELAARYPDRPYLLFPEDRAFPIRMTDDLPYRWVKSGPAPELAGHVKRGEFYSFQIGVFAARADVDDIRVEFSGLQDAAGKLLLPASALHSFNTGGVNWDGKAFKKTVKVTKGKVQPLWFGLQIPDQAPEGQATGQVVITPAGNPSQTVRLALTVDGDLIPDYGDDELWRHSRLRWLDSQLAVDDEIVRPFTPMSVNGSVVGILGRNLTVDRSGLPRQIESYFSPEVTHIEKSATPLLASPVRLVIENAAGQPLLWTSSGPSFKTQRSGLVEWQATSGAAPLTMTVEAAMEFDGFVNYRLTLGSSSVIELNDIRLELPIRKEVARYMMGLGLKGGFGPPRHDWNWDVTKNQDGAWMGDANAGMQFSLRAENYSRPLNTNFYQSKPLDMPPSWFNEGKGGISIRELNNATVLVSCYSGKRVIGPGDRLHFDFTLLLTPFKPLDTSFQWSGKFYHSFRPIAEVMQSGANIINVHHANDANPYINYPFLHQEQMKSYVDDAHRNGLRVKIYYTIRELSNHAAELFALRSLGNEIFSSGPGGGFSWLQEHIGTDYIAAWFVPQLKDAAIINSGMSRWHNYYIEGLDWLVRKMGIDGLYIDDVAFDRTTMKRVRKVLDRRREGALIDLHSANQFNPRDGLANSANLYLEHFPYINRLWFGEYFDPNAPPDFWLIEMSGIPYGLMGEMLQDGGNKWRGMVYGMTNRMAYQGNDPSPIWKVWDEFQIQKSEMFGYWSPRCPVRTDKDRVLATAYVGAGKTLIAIGSWAEADTTVRLSIDWRALGLDPGKAVLTAPPVRDFQPAAKFQPSDSIPVQKGKGWLLILRRE